MDFPTFDSTDRFVAVVALAPTDIPAAVALVVVAVATVLNKTRLPLLELDLQLIDVVLAECVANSFL